MHLSRFFHAKILLWSSTLVVLTLLSAGLQPARRAQEHSGHEMHAGMSMPLDGAAGTPNQAKLLADKRESEFNHHLAGLFVLVAGLIILADGSLHERLRF